jgi:hypothetical protein
MEGMRMIRKLLLEEVCKYLKGAGKMVIVGLVGLAGYAAKL